MALAPERIKGDQVKNFTPSARAKKRSVRTSQFSGREGRKIGEPVSTSQAAAVAMQGKNHKGVFRRFTRVDGPFQNKHQEKERQFLAACPGTWQGKKRRPGFGVRREVPSHATRSGKKGRPRPALIGVRLRDLVAHAANRSVFASPVPTAAQKKRKKRSGPASTSAFPPRRRQRKKKKR